jgi:hypothetical protein
MPRGDGTGPAGQGPMTGRGMGYCAGFDVPGYANGGYIGGISRGFGRGFGRGRGFGFRARTIPFGQPVAMTEKQEKQVLEDELAQIAEYKGVIESRLKNLKS